MLVRGRYSRCFTASPPEYFASNSNSRSANSGEDEELQVMYFKSMLPVGYVTGASKAICCYCYFCFYYLFKRKQLKIYIVAARQELEIVDKGEVSSPTHSSHTRVTLNSPHGYRTDFSNDYFVAWYICAYITGV